MHDIFFINLHRFLCWFSLFAKLSSEPTSENNQQTNFQLPFYYHIISLNISNALKILSDQPTTQEIQFTLLKSSQQNIQTAASFKVKWNYESIHLKGQSCLIEHAFYRKLISAFGMET